MIRKIEVQSREAAKKIGVAEGGDWLARVGGGGGLAGVGGGVPRRYAH